MNEFSVEYLKTIKGLPIFKEISEEYLLSLLTCLRANIKSYHKNEYILMYTESVHYVGIVLEGKVEMLTEDLWGNKSVLTVVNKNDLFGETFACGTIPSATVSFATTAATKVLNLSYKQAMHTCSRNCDFHHRFVENMVTLIANKNLLLIEKISIISKKSIREKIYEYLLIQAKYFNSKYFTINLGRVELANYLCVDRSSLTRELNLMKEEGLIDFDKNTFRIYKPF